MGPMTGFLCQLTHEVEFELKSAFLLQLSHEVDVMAKKLALIDPDLLMGLLAARKPAAPIDPTLRQLSSTDDQMNKLIREKSTNPTLTVKKYNELLGNYATHNVNYKTTPTLPPVSISTSADVRDTQSADRVSPSQVSVQSPDKVTDQVTDRWQSTIIKSLPKSLQRRGEMLLSHIKESEGRLSWDNEGRLIRRGVPIPNTNILDLVHSVVRERKIPSPPGQQHFLSELQDLNTANELYNTRRRKQFTYVPPPSTTARPTPQKTASRRVSSKLTPFTARPAATRVNKKRKTTRKVRPPSQFLTPESESESDRTWLYTTEKDQTDSDESFETPKTWLKYT